MDHGKPDITEVITTGSWRVTLAQKLWVEEQARRRAGNGSDGNQSAVVREALDVAMKADAEPVEVPA